MRLLDEGRALCWPVCYEMFGHPQPPGEQSRERSRPGKPVIRIIPMFPELRPVLLEAHEQAADGSVYVYPRARDGSTNLRTQMHRIIKKAKVTPCPVHTSEQLFIPRRDVARLIEGAVVAGGAGVRADIRKIVLKDADAG